ncbi:NAD-dependent epimerase/dehydratase family protein [Amylibacter sp.]|nr:NAD-dependent epimerase/dehydratase family protein [Amylibacter sp.]
MIFVTGSNGYVGQALVLKLDEVGYEYCTLSHKEDSFVEYFNANNSNSPAKHTLVHIAGLAHKRNRSYSDFYDANVQYLKKTLSVLEKQNISRVVYISSISVYGDNATGSISEDCPTLPTTNYGKSKLYAEHYLTEYCNAHGIQYYIVRPPLIIGPNCPGNLNRLFNLIMLRIPIPRSRNQVIRQFVGIRNFISLILTCIEHDNRESYIFNVADQDCLSVVQIVDQIGNCMAKRPFYIDIDRKLIDTLISVTCIASSVDKFRTSLLVNDQLVRSALGYRQEWSFESELSRFLQAKLNRLDTTKWKF